MDGIMYRPCVFDGASLNDGFMDGMSDGDRVGNRTIISGALLP